LIYYLTHLDRSMICCSEQSSMALLESLLSQQQIQYLAVYLLWMRSIFGQRGVALNLAAIYRSQKTVVHFHWRDCMAVEDCRSDVSESSTPLVSSPLEILSESSSKAAHLLRIICSRLRDVAMDLASVGSDGAKVGEVERRGNSQRG
jgi:hypothetical protein